jgi:hypothetical protein
MRNKLTGQFSISTTALAGLLFFSMSSAVIASSDCENFKGCEKKFCEIEKQLTISLEKGNERKANGLRKSLKNAKDHCTDKGLEKDLIEEIKEAKEEIAKYESDLKKAKEYGKTDKIRKYQDKIEEEKNKIKHLEYELSDLD